MTRSTTIGLAAILLLDGVTFAMAQNGRVTGGYRPRTNSPNSYDGYSEYYARNRVAPYCSSYCRTPYYVLGYPVPHYGYKGWCFWR
jgi:hypothetical protein